MVTQATRTPEYAYAPAGLTLRAVCTQTLTRAAPSLLGGRWWFCEAPVELVEQRRVPQHVQTVGTEQIEGGRGERQVSALVEQLLQFRFLIEDMNESGLQSQRAGLGLDRIEQLLTGLVCISGVQFRTHSDVPAVAHHGTADDRREKTEADPTSGPSQAPQEHIVQSLHFARWADDIADRGGHKRGALPEREIQRLDTRPAARLDRQQPTVRGESVLFGKLVPILGVDLTYGPVKREQAAEYNRTPRRLGCPAIGQVRQ